MTTRPYRGIHPIAPTPFTDGGEIDTSEFFGGPAAESDGEDSAQPASDEDA